MVPGQITMPALMAGVTGDYTITRHNAGDYIAIIDITAHGIKYKVLFDGTPLSYQYDNIALQE